MQSNAGQRKLAVQGRQHTPHINLQTSPFAYNLQARRRQPRQWASHHGRRSSSRQQRLHGQVRLVAGEMCGVFAGRLLPVAAACTASFATASGGTCEPAVNVPSAVADVPLMCRILPGCRCRCDGPANLAGAGQPCLAACWWPGPCCGQVSVQCRRCGPVSVCAVCAAWCGPRQQGTAGAAAPAL